MSQDQLVAGSCHPDVEEAAFLLEMSVALGQLLGDEFRWQCQRFATRACGKPAIDEPDHEDNRELEALGLVDRENGNGVRIGVHLGCGGIVAGVDQRLQVAGDEHDPVIRQQVRLGAHDFEEPGNVLERFLSCYRIRGGKPREQAAVAQEPVQDLAGGLLVSQFRVAADVRH